jgi:hypothetical protein
MQVSIEGLQPFEANAVNTAIFTGSTMLSGIYCDQDDDYVFIPEGVIGNYDEVVSLMQEEQIPTYNMDGYDPNAQPFCFMINGLCRVFRTQLDHYGVDNES